VTRFSQVSGLLALLLAGCSEPAPAEVSVSLVSDRGLLDADIRVATPVARGPNELFVQLHPRHGAGEAALISVRATMAAHGHQSSEATVERTEAGFHADNFDLFMSGRWHVVLELALDEQRDSVSLPVDVP
jgi:hypothetical protein